MLLSRAEAETVAAKSAQVEARIGAQVVAAVVDKADAHVELPWKAFTLGAVLSGLAIVIADALRPQWLAADAALIEAMTILGAGAISALAAIFFPAYARTFLRPTRRDAEVRRCAEALFLRHELFRTRARNGVLILVCCFERKVEILADVGLNQRVSEAEWRSVITRVAPMLGQRRFADALLEALTAVEEIFTANGLAAIPDADNELPDRPIDESGSA